MSDQISLLEIFGLVLEKDGANCRCTVAGCTKETLSLWIYQKLPALFAHGSNWMLDTELCWWCGCLKSVKSPLMANLDIYVLIFSSVDLQKSSGLLCMCGCGSWGRAGHPLIWSVAAGSLAAPVLMLKHPWARCWTLNCSRCIHPTVYV